MRKGEVRFKKSTLAITGKRKKTTENRSPVKTLNQVPSTIYNDQK